MKWVGLVPGKTREKKIKSRYILNKMFNVNNTKIAKVYKGVDKRK